MFQRFLAGAMIMQFAVTIAVAQTSNANVAAVVVHTQPPAKSTVRGRVFYGDTGRAVRRASVMLLADEAMSGSGREAVGLTDSEGYFQIKNVRAGVYFAMVNAPGVVSPMAYADFSKLGPGGSEKEAFDGAFARFEKIIVNGMTDVDVQIPAKRGGAISGRVTYADGDPAIGIKVEVLRKEGESFVPVVPNFSAIMAMFSGGSNQTDDRGIYRFSGLPRGDYRVKVTENITHSENAPRQGYYDPLTSILTSGGSIVSVYHPDISDPDKAHIVPVELGAEQFDINVVLPDRELRRISGKIVAGKDKKGVKNAVVSLKRKGETEASIFTQITGNRAQGSVADEEGNWSFKELPKGDYQLIVESPSTNYYPVPGGEDEHEIDLPQPGSSVVIRKPKAPEPKYARKVHEIRIEDKDVSQIVVELGFGATMSGSVTVENSGTPPGGVTVITTGDSEESATTGSTGTVDDNAPAGRAASNSFKLENISVGKTRLTINVPDESFYVKTVLFEGRDLLADPFELKEGDNLAGIKIVLGKDVGTLTGKVLDANKEPAKRVEFMLVPTDAAKRKNPTFYRRVATDENGDFKTKGRAIEYAVIFRFAHAAKGKKGIVFDKWLDEVISAALKASIKENDTTILKLTLPDK